MGQGIIGDVSAKLIDTFAENLAAMLAQPAAAEPEAPAAGEPAPAAAPPPRPAHAATRHDEPEGLPIMSVLGSVVAGRLRDPRVVAGGIVAVGLLLWVLGRRAQR
jgi:uncharacterized protein